MRIGLILLLLCGAWARAADVLVLVSPQDAGPAVQLEGYFHPTWILWPAAASPRQGNRLSSLPSGVDWRIETTVGAYLERNGRSVNLDARSWANRGYFESAAQNLASREVIVLEPGDQVALLQTAFAGIEGARILKLGDYWPSNALIVATAVGPNPWDRIAMYERKSKGRVLVVEVPDSSVAKWTRMWFRGTGWPDGVPNNPATRIPGLLPARSVMSLVANPTRHSWEAAIPDPPDRWLSYGHQTAPVVLVFLAVAAAYVLGMGIFMVMREQNSRFAKGLIHALVLGPAAIILGGRLTAVFGLSQWLLGLVVAFLTLAIASLIVQWLANRFLADVHPLWSVFVVGLVVSASVDPVWSAFSHTLGSHLAPISPEAFGALSAYSFGSAFLVSRSNTPRLIVAILASLGITVIPMMTGWIATWQIAFVAAPILMVGQKWVSRMKLAIPAMAGLGLLSAFFWPGLTYAPSGLLIHANQAGKNNCAEQIAFLMSPTFLSFSLAVFMCGIAGDHFFGHQLRRALAFSPLPMSILYAAMALATLGIFVPVFLHAALATAISGGVCILYDAIRSP